MMKSPAIGVCLSLAVSGASAAGDPFPASGSTTYTTYNQQHMLGAVDLGDGNSQSVWEISGITHNLTGQKVFDNMSVHCVALFNIEGGRVASFNGSCSETDLDGDKVFTTFDRVAVTIIGGAGKYKGISGYAPTTVTLAPAPGPGQTAVVVEQNVTWQIK